MCACVVRVCVHVLSVCARAPSVAARNLFGNVASVGSEVGKKNFSSRLLACLELSSDARSVAARNLFGNNQSCKRSWGKKIFLRDFWLAWNFGRGSEPRSVAARNLFGNNQSCKRSWEKKFFFRDFWLAWNLAPTRALGPRNRPRSRLGTSSGTTKVASEVGKKKFFFATSGLLGT